MPLGIRCTPGSIDRRPLTTQEKTTGSKEWVFIRFRANCACGTLEEETRVSNRCCGRELLRDR